MKYCFYIASILLLIVNSLLAQQTVNSQVSIDREAQFPGGDSEMIRYIYENIQWPESVKGISIDDILMLSIDVRADSLIENIVYLKKVGYGIDEQIVELLKRKKFIPSIQNGIPVKMSIILSIPIRHIKK